MIFDPKSVKVVRLMPGRSNGTKKPVTPEAPALPVRASRMMESACATSEIDVFSPFST